MFQWLLPPPLRKYASKLSRDLRVRRGDTVWERVSVELSGILQVHGWSVLATGELPLPRLTLEGNGRSHINLWRYPRPDLNADRSPVVLQGFCYEWVLPEGRIGTVTLDLPDIKQRQFVFDNTITKPDYDVLVNTPHVWSRAEIYGSGLPLQQVTKTIRSLIPLMKGRVLDLGCGSGALVSELRSRGVEAFGVEVDRPAIKDNLLPEAAPYTKIYPGGRLPFDDNSFDYTVAIEVIEHIEDYPLALSEIRRVSPKLIATVPDMSVIPLLHRHNVVPWHLLESTHVNFFNETSFRKALAPYYRKIDIGRLTPAETNRTRYFLSLLAVCEEPV